MGVAQEQPGIICVASLPPGGLAHTRYLCKRLRSQFPEMRILVGRFGLRGNVEQNRTELRESGANEMATTILEMRTQLNALTPVLVGETMGVADKAQELAPDHPEAPGPLEAVAT
jgi:hypothetical protein